MSSRTLRRLAAVAAAGAAALATAPSASAGKPEKGPQAPAPVPAEQWCPDQETVRPYVLYLDFAEYFMAPGGDFEGSGTSWKLGGLAGLLPKGRINDFGGEQVMRLPLGSSVTSPPICVDVTRTKLRMDVKAGWLLSRLRVDAVREDGRVVALGGVTAILDTLLWGVSPEIPLAGPLGVERGRTETVRLRVTAATGPWMIDDVTVDPFKTG